MKNFILALTITLFVIPLTFAQEGIQLKGTVSAENNQIKNVANPTDAQDVVTKSYFELNSSNFSGSYNDLINKPVIPTSVSELTNDAGYITTDTNTQRTDEEINSLINANTNDYITEYTVTESDVTAHQEALSLTESQISNLSHFSGDYEDLTNKPVTYTKDEVDAIIASLQAQINELKNPESISSISFYENIDLETGEICEYCDEFAEAKYDLAFAYNGNDTVHSRMRWNESSVDVALVFDKTFAEISLNDISSYYFCEHINDNNTACSNTTTPPTNFFAIYKTSDGNFYAVEYLSETATEVTFRYKKLN